MIKVGKRYALDERDETIIRMLSDNGRATKTEIAEVIGVTRLAVSHRMAHLEQAGIIKGYSTIIDWDKVLGGGTE